MVRRLLLTCFCGRVGSVPCIYAHLAAVNLTTLNVLFGRMLRDPPQGDTKDSGLSKRSTRGYQWVQHSDGLQPGTVLRDVGPATVYGPFLEWLVSSSKFASTS